MEGQDASQFYARKDLIKGKFKDQLEGIEPVLIYRDGIKQVCSGELLLKLRNNMALAEFFGGLEFVAKQDEFVKNQYLVRIENFSTHQLFSMIGELNENENAEFAEPNFTRLLKPHTADQYFSSQWSVNNQGYLGSTVDADMDVDNVWVHATGQGIKVAIIDEGVNLTHPDLASNLLQGYDATGNNSAGAPSNNDAHGTACAGIVAAIANNAIGIAGVAYNSKVIPVRIAYRDSGGDWVTSDTWIANGINWAVQNGADILSNSWGGGSPSSTIANAINNAINNGRNGKGCTVLFSSGNENGPVSYPATLSGVIAVGASSMCDERKNPSSCDVESWGSNYGTGIDVVAPGVKIYTTDISGPSGYNSGDYRSDFNGTSSACPNAAGVAALILSVNANLTQSQVRQILELNTDKIGSYTFSPSVLGQPNGTWNSEVGYGRLNACQAVLGAIGNSINGPSLICTTGTFTIPANNVTWSTSNPAGLSINASTGLATRINNFNGQVTVTATISGGMCNSQFTLQAYVGKPATPGYPLQPISPMCVNQTKQATIAVVLAATSFTWWSNDPNLDVGNTQYWTSALVTAYAAGVRVFTITSNNSCGSSSPRQINVGVVSCGGGPNNVVVSPNPASTTLTVESILSSQTTDATSAVPMDGLWLRNEQGIVVVQSTEKNIRITLPIGNLPKGFYYMTVKMGDDTEVQRIVIDR